MLKIGIEAVQLACKTISELPLKVQNKLDTSPVTLADFTSQAIITTMLNGNVIAEESLPNDVLRSEIESVSPIPINWDAFDRTPTSEIGWFLDPIDGTKGYVRNDQYAVCLAYFDKHVQFSIIGCPNLGFPTMSSSNKGTILVAIKDNGCYQAPLNKPFDLETALQCKCRELASIAQSFESSHVDQTAINNFIQKYKITDIVRMDSQAKYVVVARGEVGFYLRATPTSYTEKIWDHACGVLAITESNGVCKQLCLDPIQIKYQRDLIVDGIVGCHKNVLK